MGDVVPFKSKNNIDLSQYKSKHFQEFCDFHEKHIDTVTTLANFVCLNASKDLDIGHINEYDFFMLRECVMSLVMRSHGIHHPLQDLTEEYRVFFGGEPSDIED